MKSLYFARFGTTTGDLSTGDVVLQAGSGVTSVERIPTPSDGTDGISYFRVVFERPVGDGVLQVMKGNLRSEGDVGRFDGDNVIAGGGGPGNLHVLVVR